MAETFLEALARLRGGQAAGATPLPTGYSQIQVPQGTLRDADTRTTPTGEVLRTAGINAPELMTQDHKQLIPEGQQATARTADLLKQAPNTQIVRYGNDHYGRTVADDVGPDGQPIAAQQVRQGLASPVDYNHSGTTRFSTEATQRFMEQHPPSEDTLARAAYLQRPHQRPPAEGFSGLDPKYRTLGEEFKAGVNRGLDQAQAGGYGALSMAGAILKNDKNGREPRALADEQLTLRDRITNWMERVGEKGYMRNTEESQLNPPAYHLKDVQEGKADLLQWGLGVLGEALPSTATMALTAAATSGAGALVGGAVGRSAAAPLLRQIATKSAEDLMTTAVRRRLLAMGLTENSAWTPAMIQRAALSVAKDPVKAAMGTYAKRGGFAGAWAGSSALEGGHAYEDAKQALGQANINPWVTAASGGLAGLLDTAAVAYLAAPFAKLFATPAAEASLAAVQGATKSAKLLNVVKEVAKGAGLGMLAEGSTEALQEVIGAAATEIQRTDDPRPLTERLMSPAYLQRYLEAGVSGLVFGGVFGVGHGGAQAFNHRQRTAAPAPVAPEVGPSQPDTGANTQGMGQQEMGAPTREVPPLTGPILNDTGAPVPVDPSAELSDEDRRRNEQYRQQLEALRQPAIDPQTAGAPQAAPIPPAAPDASIETGPAPGTPDAAESLAAQLAAPPSAPLDPGTVRPASPGPTLNDAGAPVPVDPNAGPTIEDLARRDQFNRQVEAARGGQAAAPIATETNPIVPEQEPSPSLAARTPTPLDGALAPSPSAQNTSPRPETPINQASGVPETPINQASGVPETPINQASGVPTPAPPPSQNTPGRSPVLDENTPGTGKATDSSETPLGEGGPVIVPQAPVTAMEGIDNIPSKELRETTPPQKVERIRFLPGGQVKVRVDGQDQVVSREVYDQQYKPLLPESQPTIRDQRRAAPNISPPVVANETASRGTQPSLPSTSEPQTPVVRRGHAQARQLTHAWRQLLGLSEAPAPALSDAQAQALTEPNTEAHYHAVQALASQVGAQVMDEHLAKADEKTLAEIQKSWKTALGTDSTTEARRAWLSDRIGEVLLHDDKMRRIYADRNLPLVYKWLRTVGQQLLKLVNAVRAKLGFTSPAPPAVVTRFVHALVDQQRTRQAEALGLSPNLTTGLQEATNALLSDAPAKLDALEAAIGKTPHPIYTPWLQALRQVEVAVTGAEIPGLREKASTALRQALAQVDPAWATADPIARRTLRQRQRNALPSLAGLQATDPKTADAVRAVMDAVWTAEDALHRAGSLQRAALDLQEQAGLKLTEKQRTTLADLLNLTRQERLQDRRLRQAFVEALGRAKEGETFASASARFDALAPKGQTPGRSLMRTRFMAKHDTMGPQLAAFQQRLTGRESATLNTVWLALGLAQDELPALVPMGKDWAEFGVQYDPANTEMMPAIIKGVADYVAQERLFERLPARHRDALAAAYIAHPERMGINEWLGEHLVRALKGDPVLYQVVLLAEAAPGGQLGYARHTPQHLLTSALLHDGDSAHPAMLDALHHRLNNRYGTDAVARAEHVLQGTGDRTNLWYLLSQGIHVADGELRVDTEARARAQALIRAAGRVEGKQEQSEVEVLREALGDEGFNRLAEAAPEVREGRLPGAQSPARRTPGVRSLLDVATKALNGYYTRLDQLETALEELSPHFDALLETARILKHDPKLTLEQLRQDLLQWRHTLRAARKAAPTVQETLPGEELASETDLAYTETGVEDEEGWMEKEYLDAVELGAIHDQTDGPDIGSEAEIVDALGYENAKEREARPTILRQGLALFTEYTPTIPNKTGEKRDVYGKARVRHRFAPIKIEDRLDVGTVLNSDNAVSIESPIAVDSKLGKSEPFTVDPGHELFRQLPAETQAMLFERAQILGRMGVEAEYRLARHLAGERNVDYLEEQLHLTDSATLYTGTIADGQLVSEQLLLDRIGSLLEEARRDARKIPGTQRVNRMVDFNVLAATDHPLLTQISGVMERVLPLDALRRLWADNRGWAPGVDGQGRSRIPQELRQALEKAAGDLHTALQEDAGLSPLLENGHDFTRLLAAALGHGHEIFSTRRPPDNAAWSQDKEFLHQLDQQPNLPGYQRTTQPESRLEITESFADRLGIDKDPVTKSRMIRLYDQRRKGEIPGSQRLLDFLLRAYLDSYDPRTGTFDAGAQASVTADALVKVGKNTLTGLEASPDVHYNRIDALMRGVDLAGRMAAPWASVQPDPHLNPDLVLFQRYSKDGAVDWTVAKEQERGADTQRLLERMAELDQEAQVAIAQLERTQAGVQAGILQLGDQVIKNGKPLWTLRGVLPFEVEQWIDALDRPSKFDAQPQVKHPLATDRPAAVNPERKRFRWIGQFTSRQSEGAPTIDLGPALGISGRDLKFTARPLTHLDELTQKQAELAGIRGRLGDFRVEAQKRLADKRSLGGSELNQFATFEEEMSNLFAWIDQMGVGNHQARVQTESQLFNPDLGAEGKKWDADLRNYQREGHTQLAYRGEQPQSTTLERTPPAPPETPPAFDGKAAGIAKAQAQRKANAMRRARERKPLYQNFVPNLPEPKTEIKAPNPLSENPETQLRDAGILPTLWQQFTQRAVDTLGLDTKAMRITFVDLEALQGQQDRASVMERLGLADIAEQVWAHGAQESFFTVLKGGQARVILMNGRFVDGKFQRATEEELQDALAHELGHVFFHQRMAAALEKTATRAKLVRLLEGRLPEGYNDLHIEEATAEVVRGWLQGETTPARPGQATLLGKLFKSLQDGLKALLGLHSAKITLDDLLSHAAGRAAEQAEGFRNYSGRQLLADARQYGPQFAKDTWATAKALFDNLVRTAHSWLRNQRNIKGESIESFGLLADILRWTPGKAPRTRTLGGQLFDFTSTGEDSYHQSFEAATGRMFARWGTRIERELHPLTLEEQRQAVSDYANGVKTPHSEMLTRLFSDMGGYFGPVLKRYDPAKALPRIFDQTALKNLRDKFLTLLQKKGLTLDEAEQLLGQLTRESGSDYRADAGQFFAPHFQRARQGDFLDAVTDAELLPYLLVATQPQAALWQYTHQMVKRTEFERRFGGWVQLGENTALDDTRRPTLVSPTEAEQLKMMEPYKFTESGYPLYRIQRKVNGQIHDVKIMWDHTAKFRHLRALAAEQGASHAQLNQLTRVMEAELGRYGADFSPRLRTMQSAMISGMNWAVLPLSLLSQPTDLALPLLRANGNFKLAWRGMKMALKALREKEANGLYLAARANGILAGNLREYFSSAYLDTPFLSAKAQKLNQTLFKYNGMEYATELVRMFAFAMGHEWIQDLTAKQTAEAEEQLAQLGLDRADVLAWQRAQQRLDDGLSPTSPEVERVQQALNTFVEQSMFRPSASQRPTWASHPAAMLVWYLKSYIWSYADTILARTWREVKRMDGYGQKAMMLSLPFLFMLPLAALGLLLRDELRDTLPLPWRAPKRASATEDDSAEYMARLISRTGLFGPMQMLLDAGRASEYGNPYYLSLIGPFATMPDQLIRSVAGASDEHRGRAFTDAILRLAPILGSLPQERRALLDTVY